MITPDTKVWHAAAWWHDSEPFVNIVATTKARLERMIDREIKEEAERAADGDVDSDDPEEFAAAKEHALDQIAWSGSFQERLGDIIVEREFESVAGDLANQGYAYLALP